MSNTQLTVGQTLWYVPTAWGGGQRPGCEVTVTKIGTRWATLDWPGRIDKRTWRADGGEYSSPGRCYLSREHHDAHQRTEKVWNALAKRIQYANVPVDATEAKIHQAAALLGIELGVIE